MAERRRGRSREGWVDCPVICLVCGGEFTLYMHKAWVPLYRGQAFQTCSRDCSTVHNVQRAVAEVSRRGV